MKKLMRGLFVGVSVYLASLVACNYSSKQEHFISLPNQELTYRWCDTGWFSKELLQELEVVDNSGNKSKYVNSDCSYDSLPSVELNQSNGVRLRYLDELVIVQTPLQGTIIEKDIDKPREVIMQISGKDFSVMVESAYKVRAEGKEILDEYVIFLKDK